VAKRAPGRIDAVEVQVGLAVLPLPPTGQHLDLDTATFNTTLVRMTAKIRAEAANGGWPAVARGVMRTARRSALDRVVR